MLKSISCASWLKKVSRLETALSGKSNRVIEPKVLKIRGGPRRRITTTYNTYSAVNFIGGGPPGYS